MLVGVIELETGSCSTRSSITRLEAASLYSCLFLLFFFSSSSTPFDDMTEDDMDDSSLSEDFSRSMKLEITTIKELYRLIG